MIDDRRRTDLLLSVVLPVYNESRILNELVAVLESSIQKLGYRFELIFINDGSKDGSAELLDQLASTHDDVKVVHFSRNFGHQAAVQAGMSYASGDVVVIMDSDMQDTPDAIPLMLDKWREGYDVVYAIRTGRKENPIKVFLFNSFYRVLNKLSDTYIPMDAGNFGIVDGRVARMIAQFQEADRYYPGIRSWVGFRQIGVTVPRGARYDDKPRVSLWGLFSLAKTAIFSFSTLPLLMFYVFSAAPLVVFFGFSAFAMYHKFVTHLSIPGWTSTVVIACLFGSLNSLGIAILGEYISRIYRQVRSRPPFIVARAVNFEHAELKDLTSR